MDGGQIKHRDRDSHARETGDINNASVSYDTSLVSFPPQHSSSTVAGGSTFQPNDSGFILLLATL